MSTATLSPPSDGFGDDFRRIVEGLDAEDRPRRIRTRTVIVPEREAIDQGLRFRRHRTREREA